MDSQGPFSSAKFQHYGYKSVGLSSSKMQKFRIFGKNFAPKGRISSNDFFTKLGMGKGVAGPPPRAKFHHCGSRNVFLSLP